VLWGALSCAADGAGECESNQTCSRHGGVTLLQVHPRQADSGSKCATMRDWDSYSTIQLQVGSPGVSMDVVADTGSDTAIIVSCLCSEYGNCNASNTCFGGTNVSSTYSSSYGKAKDISYIQVVFGSGDVVGFFATDVLSVAGISAQMNDSLLLMVSQTIDIDAGVLGLGLPENGDKFASAPSFLEAAGVQRFSLCLNYDGVDGVMRLDPPAFTNAVQSIGTNHWGLEFRGVSVGGTSISLCSPSSMSAGQKSPCGAIPDSGTTLILAPADHLVLLYDALCTEWPLCVQYTQKYKGYEKHEVFQILLYDCEEWMGDDGLSELPTLTFALSDPSGLNRTLDLRPEDWVITSLEDEVKYVRQFVNGVLPVDIAVSTGKKTSVCFAAFGEEEYETEENGPIWVFGRPFFQRYVVGFDMNSTSPSVSFQDAPCGACNTEEAALLGTSSVPSKGANVVKPRMRGIHRPMRRSRVNTSLPL